MTAKLKDLARATLLVSCARCGKLHSTKLPLEFHPVCNPCTIPPGR